MGKSKSTLKTDFHDLPTFQLEIGEIPSPDPVRNVPPQGNFYAKDEEAELQARNVINKLIGYIKKSDHE